MTCKNRRVKCDEKRPECDRCRNAGRSCDGYATGSFNKTTNIGRAAVGGQLSSLNGAKNVERRAFDFFLSWYACLYQSTVNGSQRIAGRTLFQ